MSSDGLVNGKKSTPLHAQLKQLPKLKKQQQILMSIHVETLIEENSRK